MNSFQQSQQHKMFVCIILGIIGLILTVSVYIFHPHILTSLTNFLQVKEVSIDENILAQRPKELAALREFWKEQIQKYGGEEAYRAFGATQDTSSIDIHTQAHIFGEALYEVMGMEGVKICDSNFRFGCYHSFFGIAIHNEGIEILPQLDALCKEAYGEEDTRCQHGIGHGLLVYTGYENLVEALDLCATFQWQETGSCTGGTFMEYNFHTMEEAEGVHYSRDPKDGVYEPCISLPKKFQASCYNEQVQWWLDVFDNNYEYVGNLCKQLAGDHASWAACYQRVGNFFTEFNGADYDKIIAICSKMENEEAKYLCQEGSTSPMAGVSEFKETHLRICETLSAEAERRCVDFANNFN